MTKPTATHPRDDLLMQRIPRVVWFVCIILLVVAVFRMPYGYYTFLRITICAAAALIATVGLLEQTRFDIRWTILFVLIVILVNPILPIRLHRAIWFYLDLTAAALFLAHLSFRRSPLVRPGCMVLPGPQANPTCKRGDRGLADVDDDMVDTARELAALLTKGGSKACRRYEVRTVNGRPMLVRNEIDRYFDLAMSEVFGTELEPDEKDGMFLD